MQHFSELASNDLRPRNIHGYNDHPAAASEPSVMDYKPKVKEPSATTGRATDAPKGKVDLGDAPSCHVCGAIMTRNGSCYRCMSCGSTSGCS